MRLARLIGVVLGAVLLAGGFESDEGRALARDALAPEEEPARGEEAGRSERESVMVACRDMLSTAFHARHAPSWTEELKAQASPEERERLRIYYYFGLDTSATEYRRRDDGSWEARIEGYVRVFSPDDQISSITGFVALCRVDADHAAKPTDAPKGTVIFESVSAPRFES